MYFYFNFIYQESQKPLNLPLWAQIELNVNSPDFPQNLKFIICTSEALVKTWVRKTLPQSKYYLTPFFYTLVLPEPPSSVRFGNKTWQFIIRHRRGSRKASGPVKSLYRYTQSHLLRRSHRGMFERYIWSEHGELMIINSKNKPQLAKARRGTFWRNLSWNFDTWAHTVLKK